uniref:Putative rna-binding protein rrm superfamily n=2 Tax=Triatoma infestans TaxID=30076 RepID=A0A023FBD9_TRIIF
MSRIIVKNLPNDVDASKLYEKFSELGYVTDLQLKFTPQGRFRKFCFVGYETSDQADAAVKHFNKTYFGTSRLQVELCTELGDSNKLKTWSKYSTESTILMKVLEEEKNNELQHSNDEGEQEKNKKRKKCLDDAVMHQIKKHKDDPEFIEFMDFYGKADKVMQLQEQNEEGYSNNEVQEIKNVDTNNCARSAISDLEYLRTKIKGSNLEVASKIIKEEKPPNPDKQYFTVKISNLPYRTTKKDIRRLLNPVTPASIRLPPKIKGIAFVGFESEKEKRRALIKNKTFLNGRQLAVIDYQPKQGLNDAVQNRWKEQEEALMKEENIAESGRIFIRNLAYSVSEEEIQNLFSKFGPLAEVILPVDRVSRQLKGYGIVTFVMPEHALGAYTALDGTILHGRMLHLLPAKAKEILEKPIVEEGTNYKNEKFKKLKAKAGSSYNWNSLFLDLNALSEVISKKYNVSKEDVLIGKDAAVRLALAETQLVAETKKFLEENGVKLDAFNQKVKKRSKTVILVKNLPPNTTIPEIRELFAKYGEVGRVLLPTNGITGIVEFLEPSEARIAFKRLAYSKFKYLPLYLEWAPDDSLSANATKTKKAKSEAAEKSDENVEQEEKQSEDDEENIITETNATLFVKNLNFQTSEEDLNEHFKSCGKIASTLIARKKDIKVPGSLLSMGYGFVHFYSASCAKEALKRLQGSELQGHKLELKISHKTLPEEVVSKRKKTNVAKQTGTKIMVRNIPFQATAKEITDLFKIFGELKFVRLPKKLVGTGKHRGFAFVEFVTKYDARRAMKALCQSTHLLGRRLVLEWAHSDQDVNTLMKTTAKHFHDKPRKTSKVEIPEEDDDRELDEMQF